jgi:septal ring factor EnvC (AmiA/AmiB activator)
MKLAGRKRFFFFLLLVLCGVSVDSWAQHPIKRDLAHIHQNLKREQAIYLRLRKQSTSLLTSMGELDDQIEAAEKELTTSSEHRLSLEQQLQDHRTQRSRMQKQVNSLRRRLARRLRQLYMQGETGWCSLVFGAPTIADGLDQQEVIRYLATKDQKLAQDILRSQARMVEYEAQIAMRMGEIESTFALNRERYERVSALRAEKKTALSLLYKKTNLRKKALNELKQAQKRLTRLLAAIDGQVSGNRGFASWRGRLPFPVTAGRLEVPYGRQVDRRFGTVTLHQGIDVRAERNTPVLAVYPAKVVFAEVFKGYGRLVILDHGGGYNTLYAHLEKIHVASGQSIKAQDPIGTVGESGSLQGPYLYFELRKNGKAVDPGPWLVLRK